jgi:Sulfotransferase family
MLEHRPIAITGMHRSGTSMITRGLHDSGLNLLGPGADKFIDTADDNPEGFWENAAIVACNDDLLEATGGAWDNPPAFPPQGADDPRVTHIEEAAAAALAGLRARVPWGFKDPRTCLTAAFWMDLEPDLRFIVCVRHPLEVALSLKRRNQNSYSLGLSLWERYYATALELIPPERRIVTHYDSFFADAAGELRRLCEFAGLEGVEPHIRSDLRHHEVDVNLVDAEVSPTLRSLYDELCRESRVPLRSEPQPDQGRVRRLVLDGAVARRHADQRQQEIERLQGEVARVQREKANTVEHVQREKASAVDRAQRERAEAEASFRAHLREVEVQMAETGRALSEIEQVTRRTAARVDVAVEAVTFARVKRVLRRFLARAKRRTSVHAVQPGRKVASRAKRASLPRARGAARKLPAPAQQVLRRSRRAVSSRSRRPGPSAPRPGAAASGPATASSGGATPVPPVREGLAEAL